jgi:hypothetical protein
MTLRWLGLTALLFFGTAHSELIYRWTDEAGQVHYSQLRPPIGTPGIEIVQGAPKAAVDPSAAQKALQGQVTKVDEQQQKAVEAKDLDGKVRAEIERREKNCKVARANQQTLETLGSKKLQDSEGKVFALSDEERQKKLAEAQKQVTDWCEGIPAAATP